MGDLVFVTDSSKLHVFSLMGVCLASKDVDGYGESKKITVLEPYIYVNDVLDWEPLTYRMKFWDPTNPWFLLIPDMPSACPNPMCKFTYDRRNCPATCPACKALLGGKPKEGKKPRSKPPANLNNLTVALGDNIFSLQYHQHYRYPKIQDSNVV